MKTTGRHRRSIKADPKRGQIHIIDQTALPQTAMERAEALEQLRALEYGIRIKAIETTHDTIGVDTREDLARVRALLAHPLAT